MVFLHIGISQNSITLTQFITEFTQFVVLLFIDPDFGHGPVAGSPTN